MEIKPKAGHLDGKRVPATWYYHRNSIAKYLKEPEKKKK